MALKVRVTWVPLALAGWALACGAGFGTMWVHAQTPGERGGPVDGWVAPEALNLSSHRRTLVLFAHPRCPCTRATMSELERLQGDFSDQFDTRIVFYEPMDAGEAWRHTDLWERAARLPGAEVTVDPGGRMAASAGARVSGCVAVFDRAGTLEFWGGLTAARGHEGDSTGLIAIRDILRGRQPAQRTAHVYGCALLAGDSAALCGDEGACDAGP
jgi:hypothetical protein